MALIPPSYPSINAPNEEFFRAKVTQDQLEAIKLHFKKETIFNELKNLEKLKKFSCKKPTNEDIRLITQSLKNGWNTENLLRQNKQLLTDESLKFAIQWAFPQSYYAVFAIVKAYFLVNKNTENSHTSIIKKFGQLANEKNYPKTISFLADGRKDGISYININKINGASSASFIKTKEGIETKICQFLKATRELDLDEKKKEIHKTKRIKPEDWDKVSEKEGYTSILSLLYRKRIKANYHDIETFLSDHVEPEKVFDSLIHIIECLNFIHEAYIYKGIGAVEYQNIISTLKDDNFQFLQNRLEQIKMLSK